VAEETKDKAERTKKKTEKLRKKAEKTKQTGQMEDKIERPHKRPRAKQSEQQCRCMAAMDTHTNESVEQKRAEGEIRRTRSIYVGR
jgi:hypothetical protein